MRCRGQRRRQGGIRLSGSSMAMARIELWKGATTSDMRDKVGEAFTIAPNARQIRFGLGDRADEPVVFDLAQGTVSECTGPYTGIQRTGNRRTAGQRLEQWPGWPKNAGKPIAFERYETSRSLAIRPGRNGFVLGTEYSLRAFNERGRQLWGQAGPSIAWGVNFSANGRIVVVAYGDGTIRWMRWSDGQRSCWPCSSTARPGPGSRGRRRLLHCLAWRRGFDRLAHQSRLKPGRRLLPCLGSSATNTPGPTLSKPCSTRSTRTRPFGRPTWHDRRGRRRAGDHRSSAAGSVHTLTCRRRPSGRG